MKNLILDNLEEILVLLGIFFFVVACFMIDIIFGVFSTSISLITIGLLVMWYKKKIANNDN